MNVKTASGFTPLHFAVAANCLPVVRALLTYDARIDEVRTGEAGRPSLAKSEALSGA